MKLLRKLHNMMEKQPKNSILSMLLLRDKPSILTDKYGMRFVLYPSTHEPLEKLLSKRHLVAEYAAISKILKPGNITFDVGANIGTHSVFMSKIVGQNGKVYSFEPVPETSWELKENLVLNRTENVEVTVAGASNKDGEEIMNIFPSDFSAWNSFGKPETDEAKIINRIKVATIKLDSFVNQKNIKHIDFLKIDAEGSEKNILAGAENILKNGIANTISFEISQIPLKAMGSTPKEIFDIFHSFGYKVYEFNYKLNAFVGPIIDSTVQCENYYASKKDLTDL